MENEKLTRSQKVTKIRQRLYEQVQINLPKGEREKIKNFAQSKGVSMNEFIVNSIREAMLNK